MSNDLTPTAHMLSAILLLVPGGTSASLVEDFGRELDAAAGEVAVEALHRGPVIANVTAGWVPYDEAIAHWMRVMACDMTNIRSWPQWFTYRMPQLSLTRGSPENFTWSDTSRTSSRSTDDRTAAARPTTKSGTPGW